MSEQSPDNDDLDARVPICTKWTPEEVGDYIERIGFPQYKACFTENFISGRKLILMDASQLPKVGINDFEHIKFIAGKIRDLISHEDPNYFRSISLPPREPLGMYLEMKSRTGKKIDQLTYTRFLEEHEDTKWQPPLANICLIMPR